VEIVINREFVIQFSANDSNGDAITITTNMEGAVISFADNVGTVTYTVTNTTGFKPTLTATVRVATSDSVVTL